MSNFQALHKYLTSLKSEPLRRLAVHVGTNCSGTKLSKAAGITDVLSPIYCESQHLASSRAKHTQERDTSRCVRIEQGPSHGRERGISERTSLISIDVGIRNLAFAHFISEPGKSGSDKHGNHSLPPGPFSGSTSVSHDLRLNVWRKLDLTADDPALDPFASTSNLVKDTDTSTVEADAITHDATRALSKSNFEPSEYSAIAYNLVNYILTVCQPTHVIIERQRFRTMGGKAVQEWSLRVGVFEGMLWAVLRTLAARARTRTLRSQMDSAWTVDPFPTFEIESIIPGRVNKFWFDGRDDDDDLDDVIKSDGFRDPVSPPKIPAKSSMANKVKMKRAKINLVKGMLHDAQSTAHPPPEANSSIGLSVSAGAHDTVEHLLDEKRRSAKKDKLNNKDRNSSGDSIGFRSSPAQFRKFDDLSDCFLQGLAWLRWRENRRWLVKDFEHNGDLVESLKELQKKDIHLG